MSRVLVAKTVEKTVEAITSLLTVTVGDIVLLVACIVIPPAVLGGLIVWLIMK